MGNVMLLHVACMQGSHHKGCSHGRHLDAQDIQRYHELGILLRPRGRIPRRTQALEKSQSQRENKRSREKVNDFLYYFTSRFFPESNYVMTNFPTYIQYVPDHRS